MTAGPILLGARLLNMILEMWSRCKLASIRWLKTLGVRKGRCLIKKGAEPQPTLEKLSRIKLDSSRKYLTRPRLAASLSCPI